MRNYFFLGLFVLLISSFVCAEELTITTYYPSPYGSYNELSTNRLRVGDSSSSLDQGVIQFEGLSGDPSGGEGSLYYNDTSHKFRYKDNTGWKDLGSASTGWVVMPNNAIQAATHVYWNDGLDHSPSKICQNAGYTTFSGACRFTSGGLPFEGTLLSNRYSYNPNWAISCMWGGANFYMNPSGEILCIK